MATTKKSSRKSPDPWDKPAPKRSRHTKLTSRSKAKAKAAAKKHGRKYPSLVDNMNAAKKQRAASSSRTSKKTSSKKRTARK